MKGPRARGLVWHRVGLGGFLIRAHFAAQRPGEEHGEGTVVSLGEHGRRACVYSGSGRQPWGESWLDLASTRLCMDRRAGEVELSFPLFPRGFEGISRGGQMLCGGPAICTPHFLLASCSRTRGPLFPSVPPARGTVPRRAINVWGLAAGLTREPG